MFSVDSKTSGGIIVTGTMFPVAAILVISVSVLVMLKLCSNGARPTKLPPLPLSCLAFSRLDIMVLDTLVLKIIVMSFT